MTSQAVFKMAAGLALIAAAALTPACAASKAKPRFDYQPQSLRQGQGAVLLHVINHQSLVASRWLKVDEPDKKFTFTVFHSRARNSADDRSQYDLVTVEPGTYAVYALYANCPEGYRRLEAGNDDEARPEIATALGMATWNYRLRAGSEYGWWPKVGFGIGAGRHWGGLGLGLGGFGPGYGRGLTSSCALFSQGLDRQGRPLIASLTVKPGELVYAGELTFNYWPNDNCRSSGDWAHRGEMIKRCGAARIELAVEDSFQATARPFLEKVLGPGEASKAVVRLAAPGLLANTARDID